MNNPDPMELPKIISGASSAPNMAVNKSGAPFPKAKKVKPAMSGDMRQADDKWAKEGVK